MVSLRISEPFIDTNSDTAVSTSAKIARYLSPPPTSILPPTTEQDDEKVTIVCISDTHNARPSIPSGDVLLHAGDLSQYGLFDEVQAQLDWLNAQDHAHKIVIAGNHDLILDTHFVNAHPDRELNKPSKSLQDLRWGGIVHLQDSSITINVRQHDIRIFGCPWTPRFGNFAFQHDPHQDIWRNKIPDGTDILLTHGPPATYLDAGKGCKHLLAELWRARPSLVVFGHIHSARGQTAIRLDTAQQCFDNVMLGASPWANVVRLGLARLRRSEAEPSMVLVNAAVEPSLSREVRISYPVRMR